jgi:phosphohistidine swiveling domain-containing protein
MTASSTSTTTTASGDDPRRTHRWEHGPLEESLRGARRLTVDVVDRTVRAGWEQLARHAGIPRRRWRAYHPVLAGRLVELVDGEPAFDAAAWERFVSLLPGAVALPSRTAAAANVPRSSLRVPDRRVRLLDLLAARRRRRRLRRAERSLAADIAMAQRHLRDGINETLGPLDELDQLPAYALAARLEQLLDVAGQWTIQPLVDLLAVEATTSLVELLGARDRLPGAALLEASRLQAGEALLIPAYVEALAQVQMSSGEERSRQLAAWQANLHGWHAMRALLLEAMPLREHGESALALAGAAPRTAHVEPDPDSDPELLTAIRRARRLTGQREQVADNRALLHAAMRAVTWSLARSLERSGALPSSDAAFDLSLTDLLRAARGVDVDVRPIDRHTPTASTSTRDDTVVALTPIELRGIPASVGAATGHVLLVDDPTPDLDVDGAVLVCQSTDAAWMPLLLRCAALVTERGGPLSHASIVAREIGLPTVVGARGACEAAGRTATAAVDGAEGTVRFDPTR